MLTLCLIDMYSKATLFDEHLGRLAKAAKALSHPARLMILSVLARRGTCICGDIVDELPLAQASVSRHLKVLKEAGLIQGEIDGQRSCYCIDGKSIDRLRAELGQYLEELPGAEGACC